MVHPLRYIRDSKTLGLKYYADMNDAPVDDLLRQSSIKTENHLMAQKLAEVQKHKLSFIKVVKLNMVHMFQYQLINQVQKWITMQNTLQE